MLQRHECTVEVDTFDERIGREHVHAFIVHAVYSRIVGNAGHKGVVRRVAERVAHHSNQPELADFREGRLLGRILLGGILLRRVLEVHERQKKLGTENTSTYVYSGRGGVFAGRSVAAGFRRLFVVLARAPPQRASVRQMYPRSREARARTRRCERRDSNPHGATPHEILNLARLPIPPRSQRREMWT